jgi:tritrans,polycis-undecaprenyl-diphosphate synthase [geranylgeranyl-diphosphate specific]
LVGFAELVTMGGRPRSVVEDLYARVVQSELTEVPSHVAVIQDGNRRYAESRGVERTAGHKAGAQTTEDLLRWCDQLGIEEVTLYAFSTENFERPAEEREAIFDLVTEKLREFADAEDVHEKEVRIRAIGELEQLPQRVRDAVRYADERTAEYDNLQLNIALAYGGRAELLGAAREIARRVRDGELSPEEVDTGTVEAALSEGPTRNVDLIVRSGGDERTSNFLPWQANGNEAAVYFTAPYWPEFRRIDFLRGIRTYSNRDESWRRTRVKRARALGSVLAETVVGRIRALRSDEGTRSESDPEESGEQPVESPN